jgi:hypothetical protein
MLARAKTGFESRQSPGNFVRDRGNQEPLENELLVTKIENLQRRIRRLVRLSTAAVIVIVLVWALQL